MNAKQIQLTDEVALNKGWHTIVFQRLLFFDNSLDQGPPKLKVILQHVLKTLCHSLSLCTLNGPPLPALHQFKKSVKTPGLEEERFFSAQSNDNFIIRILQGKLCSWVWMNLISREQNLIKQFLQELVTRKRSPKSKRKKTLKCNYKAFINSWLCE